MQVFLMRSIKQHVYAGEPRPIGSIYECASERDARLMTLMHNAVESAPERYQRRDVVPEKQVDSHPAPPQPVPAVKISERTGKPTREYKRRDQRAEH